jgi:hypothetical protein
MNYMYRREGILGGVDRRLDSGFFLALKRFTHIPYLPISLSTFIELTNKNKEVESVKSYIPTSLGTVVRTDVVCHARFI